MSANVFFLNIVDTFGMSAQLRMTLLPKHVPAHLPAAASSRDVPCDSVTPSFLPLTGPGVVT